MWFSVGHTIHHQLSLGGNERRCHMTIGAIWQVITTSQLTWHITSNARLNQMFSVVEILVIAFLALKFLCLHVDVQEQLLQHCLSKWNSLSSRTLLQGCKSRLYCYYVWFKYEYYSLSLTNSHLQLPSLSCLWVACQWLWTFKVLFLKLRIYSWSGVNVVGHSILNPNFVLLADMLFQPLNL